MKKIYVFSALCVALSFGLAYWTWLQLPVLEKYPLHWDANGVPNRFGPKSELFFALFMMPAITLFIAVLLALVPKIEPVRASIKTNERPYILIWGASMVLMVCVSGFVAHAYANLDKSMAMGTTFITFSVMGTSAFFIFIGNLMGKVKRNYFIGLKTPWTLSSDLSWDKTHRLSGRLFVGGGLVCMGSVFFSKPELSILLIVGMSLGVSLIALIYSYFVWKSDPNKQT